MAQQNDTDGRSAGTNKTVAGAYLTRDEAYRAAWAGLALIRTSQPVPEPINTPEPHKPWRVVAVDEQGRADALITQAIKPGRAQADSEQAGASEAEKHSRHFALVPVPEKARDMLLRRGYEVIRSTKSPTGYVAATIRPQDMIDAMAGDHDMLAPNPVRAANTPARCLPLRRQVEEVALQLCGRPADDPSGRVRLLLTGFRRRDGKKGLIGSLVLREYAEVSGAKGSHYNDDAQTCALRVWLHAKSSRYGPYISIAAQGEAPARSANAGRGTGPSSTSEFITLGTLNQLRNPKPRTRGHGAPEPANTCPGLSAKIDMDAMRRLALSQSFLPSPPIDVPAGRLKKEHEDCKPSGRDKWAQVFLDAPVADWIYELGLYVDLEHVANADAKPTFPPLDSYTARKRHGHNASPDRREHLAPRSAVASDRPDGHIAPQQTALAPSSALDTSSQSSQGGVPGKPDKRAPSDREKATGPTHANAAKDPASCGPQGPI